MHSKIKIWDTDFLQTKKMWNQMYSSKSVVQIFSKFWHLTWFIPTNQLWTFHQRLYIRFLNNPQSKTGFYNLGENLIAYTLYLGAHPLHLSARSCDTMYPMQESKSKLELFY